ncbi:flagellar motor switch protein FliG [Hydrogenispora ethanolica]|jgi:flagellar motor switch protein FliG|uniref:flagellar motor switch protein FliG n=1 Tax=Hydrogenispora ethanolica TaxID=1082276 RepID=UPI00104F745B|nr:flagellar motor switch protein FliG [Hydrogenispora ethanolica]
MQLGVIGVTRVKLQELSGKQKAAILLLSLGTDVSARVMKHLREDEIEELSLEIANLRRVPNDLKDKVLEEFHQIYLAQEYILSGGVENARELLEKAVGPQKADEIMYKLTASLAIRPFDFARKTEPGQLLNFIQNEHPQTIALVMAYLSPEQAGIILSALPPQQQVEVAKRIATMDRTSPEVIREIEVVLEKKLSSFVMQDFSIAGGLESVVTILNRVDRGTEKTILETLAEENPDLADEIKRRMFVFEDIVMLDNRSVQRFLREVDTKDLSLALKTASDEVKDLVFRNMSKRAVEILKEDMNMLGPVRLRDVEDAQQRIVNVVRQLEDSGELVISRGKEDEMIV